MESYSSGLHVNLCNVVNLLEFSLNFIVIRLLFKPFLLEEIFKVVHLLPILKMKMSQKSLTSVWIDSVFDANCSSRY